MFLCCRFSVKSEIKLINLGKPKYMLWAGNTGHSWKRAVYITVFEVVFAILVGGIFYRILLLLGI